MTKLQNFRLARYRVILTAHSPISMPPYAGSTLRGGFGHAFRKMVCTQGPIDCRDCTLKAVCPYPYIFETAPFEGAQQLRTYGDVPRPFVIDPLDTRGEYRPGESFAFRSHAYRPGNRLSPLFYSQLPRAGRDRYRQRTRAFPVDPGHRG